MAKFKKGDRVRCVRPDYGKDRIYKIGELVTVNECSQSVFNSDGSFFFINHWELATPIPDTVTIGGVEYVRKPEPEHVWAWGQWARVNGVGNYYNGKVCFILGPLDREGWVPVSFISAFGTGNSDKFRPSCLTYICTATIPE